MALVVHKYGGTSLADVKLIRRCAERVAADHAAGHRVVVVVSAMAGETDRLLGLARLLSTQPPARELDAVLAAGEQASIGLFALALAEAGVEARSWNGSQLPILTTAVHGKARIREVVTEGLRADLDQGIVPVVAGFQGIDDDGNITTLGRGGSDTTAVAVAASLEADECRIYTDVEGVYTTDPRLVPEARLLPHITFEEMLELSSLGSKVLQIRAVELAGRYRLPLRVLSSYGAGAGTLITYENSAMETPLVSGIAFVRDEAEITIVGVPERPDAAAQILAPIAAAHIEIDMIVQNAARDGRLDFTFTVHRDDCDKAVDILDRERGVLGASDVVRNRQVAKISVVGLGIRSHATIAAKMFSALSGNNIPVKLIATSEIKISVLVEEKHLEQGVRCLHDAFELAHGAGVNPDIEVQSGTGAANGSLSR